MTGYDWAFRIWILLLAGVVASAQSSVLPPPPAPPPPPQWARTLNFGFTLTHGNSDTLLLALGIRGERKDPRSELTLGADTAYGENDGDKNNERSRGFAQYNRLFRDRAHAYLRADALHDGIADVKYRFTLGPGAGYHLIKATNTTLRVEGGPSFVLEKKGGDQSSFATLRVSERFDHKLNSRARFWQSAEVLPQLDDLESFVVNAEIGVESALTKSWTLRIALQDTYDNRPARGREENDLKVITGLTWRF